MNRGVQVDKPGALSVSRGVNVGNRGVHIGNREVHVGKQRSSVGKQGSTRCQTGEYMCIQSSTKRQTTKGGV